MPGLADLSPTRIAHAVGLSAAYAVEIKQGKHVPDRRHWRAIAALAGVEMPESLKG